MRGLERRLERLETGNGRDPTLEEWLDVLDAPDPDKALADLSARYPGERSPAYRAFWDSLA